MNLGETCLAPKTHSGIFKSNENAPIGIEILINANKRFKICPTAVNPIAISPAGSKNHITANEYKVEETITIPTRKALSNTLALFILLY